MPRRHSARTLEEVREALTEDNWVPHCPSAESQSECLITSMQGGYISTLCVQLEEALRKRDGQPLTHPRDIINWNDSQENVAAVHALIDEAISLRDA